ncbi:MAG: hypothetical protein ACYTGX_06130 [Planctomycetota bacterium]
MIAPAIIRAELLRSLRGKGAPVAGVLAAGVAGAALAWSWPTEASAPDQRAAISLGVFRTLLMAQVLAIGAFGPLLVAGTLAGEREQDTWDLLRTTSLRTGELVTAKALAALLLITALAVLTLPLWGACLLLGAVAPEQFFGAFFALAGEGLCLAGIGVWSSALARRVFASSLLAVALAAPAVGFFAWTAAQLAQVAGRPLTSGLMGLGIGFVIGAPFLLVAIRFADRVKEKVVVDEHAGSREPPARRMRLGLRHDKFPDRLLLKPSRPEEWPDNADPFYLREASGEVGGMGGVTLKFALLAGSVAIVLLTLASAQYPDAWLALAIALVGTGAGAVTAAQALPSARAQGTLDVLRTVPQALLRLPVAQLRAALRLAGGIAAALCVIGVPGLIVHGIRIGWVRRRMSTAVQHGSMAVLAELLLVAGAVALGVGAGTLGAGLFKRTTGALVGALLIAGTVLAGPPLLQEWREAVQDDTVRRVYVGHSLDTLTDSMDPEHQLLPWFSIERAVRGGTTWFEQTSDGGWVPMTGDQRGGPDVLRLVVMAAWLALIGLVTGVLGLAGVRWRLRPE